MSEKVDYQEAISVKVGKYLLERGYDLASDEGLALPLVGEANALGILQRNQDAKPKKYMFGLITRREPRRVFLGVIWFRDSTRGATNEHWVLETYGRGYVELVRQLAEEMTSTFNVKITICLVQEQPKVEGPQLYYD